MLAGVVGYGPVGVSTAEVMRRLGHRMAVRDADPGRQGAARSEGSDIFEQDSQSDILFICVPETRVVDALESVRHGDITVVWSTVPPGTIDDLSARFGHPIAHVPAFLREVTALWDTLTPPFILIGSRNNEIGRSLAETFAPLIAPIQVVSPMISETVKLVLNAYLHTLVSFWNEVYILCGTVGIESYVIGQLCAQDPKVSSYGATLHGRPAGGRCLPKDLVQLIAFAEAELPPGMRGIIIGPFMPREDQRRLRGNAATNPRLEVLGFVPQVAPLVEKACRIVAMGGHNTGCEILSFARPALAVPRVTPRTGQLTRAERMRRLGLFDVLHPDRATPSAISDWLHRDLQPPGQVHERTDVAGLVRVPRPAEELTQGTARAPSERRRQEEVQHVGE